MDLAMLTLLVLLLAAAGARQFSGEEASLHALRCSATLLAMLTLK